ATFPRRVICLTEETTETLYLLGEQDRIVGISGYTVRPPEARRDKPKVSAFINAKFDKIMALEPDLVFAFSDLQADIAAELIRQGVNVFTFNQRSVDEILDMIVTVGRIVGSERAEGLVDELAAGLDAIRESASKFPYRPRAFFEEWYDPLISGIRWVDELFEIAGGDTVFPELRQQQGAKDRIISLERVIEADPQVIIGSWCGRQVKKNLIRERQGWDKIDAVRSDRVFEVKSTYILQPGPAALTEGIKQIHAILAHCVGVETDPSLRPLEKQDPALTAEAKSNAA
ncbi:MAG TPA: cobalamin-binding protein, partial [Pyrinomonadaceae bacterium]|nr:cobalamin-binding protein [Pyrinomonadaceae bacterium]